MSKSFEFITVKSGEHLHHADYKKAVRISSMRAWRRGQRQQRIAEHRQITGAIDAAQDAENSEVIGTMPALNRSAWLSVERTDPFAAMVIKLPATYQDLLVRFATYIDAIMIPLGGSTYPHSWTRTWLNHAISSPVLLMATCTHASRLFDVARRQPTSVTTLQLRSMAIDALNLALQDEATMISDNTVGAILMFTADAFIDGNAREVDAHMRALDRITAMRSEDPNDSGESTDLHADFHQRHYAPAKILIESLRSTDPILEDTTPRPIPTQAHLHLALVSLIEQSRQLTTLLATTPRSRPQTIDSQMRFADERTLFERGLVALHEAWSAHDSNSTAPLDRAGLISWSTCLALFIQAFCYLRRFGGETEVVRILIDRLTALLLRIRGSTVFVPDLSHPQRVCLLWSVVTGLQEYQGPQNGLAPLTFTETLRDLVEGMDIATMKQLNAYLQEVVWFDDAWNSRARAVAHRILGIAE